MNHFAPTDQASEHNSGSARIVLIDNHDSFVYNLVDAFAVAGYDYKVFRNTVAVDQVLAERPDLICLSPGPGHPTAAGNMMELIAQVYGQIPLLGVCLGFQALLEYKGGCVQPCGPIHGKTDSMRLTSVGKDSGIFAGLTIDDDIEHGRVGELVPIARYHSLGCQEAPLPFVTLATCTSRLGEISMAAYASQDRALGLQFHPESILSLQGPTILERCIDTLLAKPGS